MPKNDGVNKSEMIREFLIENPTRSAKEVVAALAEKGIKVTESLVYAVKGAMKEWKRRKAQVARASAAASSNGHVGKSDAITMIREVKALAQKAGGFAKLKQLVDAMAD